MFAIATKETAKRIERQGWYVVACDHNPTPTEALV